MTPVLLKPWGKHPRRATSLIEVLVAIFVMGIGCLAILAMFPLGAINMARSIKDDRCAHAGANARAIAMAKNIAFDASVVSLFNNPGGGAANAPLTGQSFAVFVDPIGTVAYAGNPATWVAGTAGLVRRSSLSFAPSSPATLTWCTLLDDINFANNGEPQMPSGTVQRDGKYSWAWLLRKPLMAEPTLCDMTIVVFEQRMLSAAGLRTANEYVYATTLASPNTVTLTWAAGQPPPPVKEGGWILDATPVKAGGSFTSSSHAKFYRVVSVADPVGTTVTVELATQVLNAGDFGANHAQFVVFPNIAEVFECGQAWKAWTDQAVNRP